MMNPAQTGQWQTKGPQGVKPVPAAVSLGEVTIGNSKSNLRPGPCIFQMMTGWWLIMVTLW